jgi:hypothetical protein
VKRFDVFVAVFNRHTVSKADALHLPLKQPLCRFAVDEKTFIFRRIGLARKWRNFVRRIENYHIAFANAVAAGRFEHFARNVRVRFRINHDIDTAAHKTRNRQGGYIGPVVVMVIRAFAVCSEVARDVDDRMIVRNRSSRIKPEQVASSGFRCRIEEFCQIDYAKASHLICAHILPPV